MKTFLHHFGNSQIFSLSKELDENLTNSSYNLPTTSTSLPTTSTSLPTTSTSLPTTKLSICRLPHLTKFRVIERHKEVFDRFNIFKENGILSYFEKLGNQSSSLDMSSIEQLNLPSTSISKKFLRKLDKERKMIEALANQRNKEIGSFLDSLPEMTLYSRYFPSHLHSSNFFQNMEGCQVVKYLRNVYSVNSKLGLRQTLDTIQNLPNSGILSGCYFQYLNNKFLVEIINLFNGAYGHYYVLVMLGGGCTVWYCVDPSSNFHTDLVSNVGDLSQFFNPEFTSENLQKIQLKESTINTANTAIAAYDEKPFSDIQIPASTTGLALPAVSLAIIVVVCICTGVIEVPH